MATDKQIIEDAFQAWADGTAHVSDLFAPGLTWEIVGRSAASRRYSSAEQFISEVLAPFGQRFAKTTPFRPVQIRGVYADGDVVVVMWDGAGTTVIGTEYANTYAWFLRMRDGLIVDGVAFFDSIIFDELWNDVDPAPPAN